MLEAVFVLLGVILALAANEWLQYSNQKAEAEAAIVSIQDEIQVNREAVVGSPDYHFQLTDTFVALLQQAQPGANENQVFPDSRIFSKGFILPASLLSTAWQTANSTGAVSNMNYEDVLTFSRIYEQQRDYEQQSRMGGQLIYDKLFNEGFGGMVRNYANLTTMIFTFFYRECAILETFDEMLSEFGRTEASIDEQSAATCKRLTGR